MKQIVLIVLSGVLIFSACEKENKEESSLKEISMGSNYANDIYFSLTNGSVKEVDRQDWDIAFSTFFQSSTVLINEGAGIKLYTYPDGDKDSWDNINSVTTDNLTAMYNADDDWYMGAFDRNQLGHPDYGWGVYNSETHDVVGDSIFILEKSDGTLFKIFIDSRNASTNTFSLKFAELGETTETEEINCSEYGSKNFIYYSLDTKEVLDREPDADSWDLLFTKYIDETINYNVTGVLTNMGLRVAEVNDVAVEEDDYSTAQFSEDINVIGWDWKSFDGNAYTIVEDLCYFIEKEDGSVYKLFFTETDGSATGSASFEVKKVN